MLEVNGERYPLPAELRDATLLDVIRDHLGLTGTKYGCGAGLCGACTVHVDGQAVRSCVTRAGDVEAKRITTIEGLFRSERRRAAAGAAGVDRSVGFPVRLLPTRTDHDGGGVPRRQPQPERRGHQAGDEWEPLPLRHVSPHSARGAARGGDQPNRSDAMTVWRERAPSLTLPRRHTTPTGEGKEWDGDREADLSRREFLVRTGWLAAGMTVLARARGCSRRCRRRSDRVTKTLASGSKRFPTGALGSCCRVRRWGRES